MKTAKQVSDKGTGLHKNPVKRRRKEEEWRKHLAKEGEHLVDVRLHVDGGLTVPLLETDP